MTVSAANRFPVTVERDKTPEVYFGTRHQTYFQTLTRSACDDNTGSGMDWDEQPLPVESRWNNMWIIVENPTDLQNSEPSISYVYVWNICQWPT